MNNLFNLFFILIFTSVSVAQEEDTVFVQFDDHYKEMRKVDFTSLIQGGSPDQEVEKSINYYIEQMEPSNNYNNEFQFSHVNRSKEVNEKFNITPPAILLKELDFLCSKKVLDMDFFRTTPYSEICDAFEEDDRRIQDVVIFMMDVDEIKNDSIVLREVEFSRPLKQ